jgi:hypothetical protein
VENKYSRLRENYLRGKRKFPMRRRREVKVDPKLGGQWNVPSLVAIGMFHVWWPLGCSMLGGHWDVACLVAIGMFQAWWPMEGERKTHFHLFHFPPTNLLTSSFFFSFGLTFLLYHGLKPLLTPFFPFLRSINYDCAPQHNKSFTPSLSI